MIEELNEHLEAIRLWIEQVGNTSSPAPGLSAEERKQLQAVNKTTQQLTRLGVSIPEDLRNLKLRLSAKDASNLANNINEEQLAKIEALMEQLRKLLQLSRLLRDRLKATAQNVGTRTSYGVTLLELIKSGHLSIEDSLELKWLKDGPTYEGKVQPDGSVMARTQSGWKRYESLSAAAYDISKNSLNGWKHWRLISRDGSSMPLQEIRSRYINKGARP